MSSHAHCQRRKAETGAVLVVSLLFLLVLTLIGLTGMQVTSLEERMSGNMRDRNLAFQAAESALRAGEMYLTLPTLPIFPAPTAFIGGTMSIATGSLKTPRYGGTVPAIGVESRK